MFSDELEAELIYYRSQHKSPGCKLTHAFGVPMIAIAIPLLFVNVKKATTLLVAGWFLQLVGHYVFEKNKPVLFSQAANPLVPLAALIVVGQYWQKALAGRWQNKEGNGRLV